MQLMTKRLTIRDYQLSDAYQVYEVINDKVIYETTLKIPYPYPKEQVETWLYFTQKNSVYQKGYECGIFLGEQYVGNIGLVNIDHTHQSAEITYFIGTHYTKQGYATEAAYAMIAFGFEEMHLERIQGRAMIHNKASIKVLEKCGFHFEGIARHEVLKEGHYLDVYHSSILRSDYLGE